MTNVLLCLAVIVPSLAVGWKLCDANRAVNRMVEAFERDQDVADESDMGEVR